MSTGEIIDAVLIIFGMIVVPFVVYLFKTLRTLELKNVELTQKLHHIEGNYKQAINHLNDEVNEIKEDIKKLLKFAYLRANDGDATMDF